MKKILIALIHFYRKYISPTKNFKCPYYPTCSEYGLKALEKYGALKGSGLAAWRIIRCNPFSKGGYDPVPDFSCKKIKYGKDNNERYNINAE